MMNLEAIAKAIDNGIISFEEINALLEEKKKAIPKQQSVAPKTKAFSVENVRSMVKAIMAGKSSNEIMTPYGIVDKQTIKRYLYRHYSKKPGYAEKYWKQLLINDRKATSVTEETAKIAEIQSITEPKPEEEMAEYRRCYTLPVRLNKCKRIIASLDALKAFAEKQYGLSDVEVSVAASTGKAKWTPTGELKLDKGDMVSFTGIDEEALISITLEVFEESEKENAMEVRYDSNKNITKAKKMCG